MYAAMNVASLVARPVAATNQKSSSMRGSQRGLTMNRGAAVVTMAKKDIHPEFFPNATVFCNGEEVTSMGGTQETYTVDIWSGNHPYYQGDTGAFITDEGRVNKFQKRFGALSMGAIIRSKGGDKDEDSAEEK